MRVEFRSQTNVNGREYKAGDVADVPENLAEALVKTGTAIGETDATEIRRMGGELPGRQMERRFTPVATDSNIFNNN